MVNVNLCFLVAIIVSKVVPINTRNLCINILIAENSNKSRYLI